MHVAVEMAPICKVGGLGDVVTSLGRAVQELGHQVEVVLPRYGLCGEQQIRTCTTPPAAESRMVGHLCCDNDRLLGVPKWRAGLLSGMRFRFGCRPAILRAPLPPLAVDLPPRVCMSG